MRPLIPRVRAGDVLLGTRNLRHYLQTANTLRYLNAVAHGLVSRNQAKSPSYVPGKNDEFLVTVNAWDTFGVYNAEKEVTLVFRNPTDPTNRKKTPSAGEASVRMDPTIFSKWFIRTRKKHTDLSTWPAAPYFMWATLHLNLRNILNLHNTGPDSAPTFRFSVDYSAPFETSGSLEHWRREQLVGLIRQWSVRGITRANASHGKHPPRVGIGPRLEEIESMREDIRKLCSNPRLSQLLKSEDR